MAKQIIIIQTPNRNIVIACLHHTFCKHECFIGKHQNQYSSFGVHNIPCIETNFQCKRTYNFRIRIKRHFTQWKMRSFQPKTSIQKNHQFEATRC